MMMLTVSKQGEWREKFWILKIPRLDETSVSGFCCRWAVQRQVERLDLKPLFGGLPLVGRPRHGDERWPNPIQRLWVKPLHLERVTAYA